MARPAKNEAATLAQGGTVVGSTFEDTKKNKISGKNGSNCCFGCFPSSRLEIR